jgi:hypothetical protein
VLPLVNRTAKAFSAWLSPAFGERLELRPDLDQVEALSIEREALWARLNQVTFLTINEKRAAVGYGPLERDGPGDSDEQEEKTGFDPSQPRVPEGGPDSGQWTGDGGGGSGGFESDASRKRRTRRNIVSTCRMRMLAAGMAIAITLARATKSFWGLWSDPSSTRSVNHTLRKPKVRLSRLSQPTIL